jgi:hypothetical protein
VCAFQSNLQSKCSHKYFTTIVGMIVWLMLTAGQWHFRRVNVMCDDTFLYVDRCLLTVLRQKRPECPTRWYNQKSPNEPLTLNYFNSRQVTCVNGSCRILLFTKCGSRDGVIILSRLRVGRFGVRFLAGAGGFPLVQNVQTGSEAHPTSYKSAVTWSWLPTVM